VVVEVEVGVAVHQFWVVGWPPHPRGAEASAHHYLRRPSQPPTAARRAECARADVVRSRSHGRSM
jgi:hypothetical protein